MWCRLTPASSTRRASGRRTARWSAKATRWRIVRTASPRFSACPPLPSRCSARSLSDWLHWCRKTSRCSAPTDATAAASTWKAGSPSTVWTSAQPSLGAAAASAGSSMSAPGTPRTPTAAPTSFRCPAARSAQAVTTIPARAKGGPIYANCTTGRVPTGSVQQRCRPSLLRRASTGKISTRWPTARKTAACSTRGTTFISTSGALRQGGTNGCTGTAPTGRSTKNSTSTNR